MNTPATPFALRRRSLGAGTSSALILSLLLLLAGRGLADNPWDSSSPAWSSTPSGAWSSWETTTGGTFGGPSHHFTHSTHGMTLGPLSLSHSLPLPLAIRNPEIDPVMLKAGSIAESRAERHSTSMCWRYVKEALVAAGGVSSYPQTVFAREAGHDLVQNHGFVRLSVHSAERAPIGSVLVYGGPGAGHVELRTTRGFVSDYRCDRPSGLPFIGAFTRLDRHHRNLDTAPVTLASVSGF